MDTRNQEKYKDLLEQAQETSRALAALAEQINDPGHALKRGELAALIAQLGADLAGQAYPTMVTKGKRMPVSAAPASSEATRSQELVKFANGRSRPQVTAADRRQRARRSSAQDHAVQLGLSDASIVKINAGAGTGKTSTLIWIAEERPGRGLYVAYNKDVQRDARQRFPAHIATYTAHAMAYAQVGAPWRADGKEIRGLRVEDIRRELGLQGDEARPAMLYAIRDTLNTSLNMPDLTVGAAHVPSGFKKRLNRELMARNVTALDAERQVAELSEAVAFRAQQMWERISDPRSSAPLPHDAYLKIWALQNPRIEADYILLDEAQDTTPVVQHLFSGQSAPLILVGDRWQAIYQYRGARNAMASINGQEARLRESYRFGQEIADAANSVLALRGEPNLLVGAARYPGRVGALDRNLPHTVIARTNATICARAAQTCADVPTAVVGGASEIIQLLKSGYALYSGDKSGVKHPAFSAIRTYKDLLEIAQNRSDGELAPIVSIIEAHGAATRGVINSLEHGLVDEEKAHVILTTAHKAKGREWDHVELASDFPNIRDSRGGIRDEEANLLYVAATRARKTLSPCQSLTELRPLPGGAHLLRAPEPAGADLPRVRWD